MNGGEGYGLASHEGRNRAVLSPPGPQDVGARPYCKEFNSRALSWECCPASGNAKTWMEESATVEGPDARACSNQGRGRTEAPVTEGRQETVGDGGGVQRSSGHNGKLCCKARCHGRHRPRAANVPLDGGLGHRAGRVEGEPEVVARSTEVATRESCRSDGGHETERGHGDEAEARGKIATHSASSRQRALACDTDQGCPDRHSRESPGVAGDRLVIPWMGKRGATLGHTASRLPGPP